MQAGKKDQPIYFEAPTTTNVGGVVTTTWADGGGNSPPQADWAHVITQRGREAFEAAHTQTSETIRLCVLYRADVQSTWRIKWLDQYYEIVHVDRSEQRMNNLWCTARLLDGS